MSSLVQIRLSERLQELSQAFSNILPMELIMKINEVDEVENTKDRIHFKATHNEKLIHGKRFKKHRKRFAPTARVINDELLNYNWARDKYLEDPNYNLKSAVGVFWVNHYEDYTDDTDEE